ncbi:hypothetical protein Dimus_009536 [Dionaea muscipula]
MAQPALITNGFIQAQILVSNPPEAPKKKRNHPGNPDPEAEVIALSPRALMATYRFLCEICGKGFQRDQNLQLHRRGHNLPWKLKRRSSNSNSNQDQVVIKKRRVYVCPERSCVHHHPSRALGDLTGIKKHFSRKHGEKKWKCDKCTKSYAVQSDWKAHSKTCGTKEYKCDCGTLFSRRDSFVTHRAFCDALAEEAATGTANANAMDYKLTGGSQLVQTTVPPQYYANSIFRPALLNKDELLTNYNHQTNLPTFLPPISMLDQKASLSDHQYQKTVVVLNNNIQIVNQLGSMISFPYKEINVPSLYSQQHDQQQQQQPSLVSHMSATALLQKAALIGSTSMGTLGITGRSCDHKFVEDHGSRLSGMFCSSSTTTTNNNIGSDLESSSVNEILQTCNVLVPPSKHQMMQSEGSIGEEEEEEEEEHTRDFMGVMLSNPRELWQTY